MQQISKFFQRSQTDVQKLLLEIEKPKVVKNLQDKFGNGAGQIDIQNISADELKALTKSLYNKILFLGVFYRHFPKDQQDKYYNYFHVAFKQLADLCEEINRRNTIPGKTIELEFLHDSVKTEIINTSNGLDLANEHLPKNIVQELVDKITVINPTNNPIITYKKSKEFKAYQDRQEKLFSEYILDKRVRDLSFKVAELAVLRFSRDPGDSQILRDQAKELAEAFTTIKDERPWFNRWIKRTNAQKLFDAIVKDINITYKKNSSRNYANEIKVIKDRVEKAQVRALFSLKGTTLYNKIIANPATPNLEPWEKVNWQKKVMLHLEFEFDEFDIYEPLHILFAQNIPVNFGLPGKVFLFLSGLMPPLSIIFAPSAKEYFKDSFLAPIFNLSDFITKPFRWCIEKFVIVPIEAPFKFFDAVREGVFESENFSPADSVFQRINSSLKTKEFLRSTVLHEKYDYKEQEEKITEIIQRGEVKNSVKPQVPGVPQKPREGNDIKFTAKFTAKNLADPEGRIRNEQDLTRGRF